MTSIFSVCGVTAVLIWAGYVDAQTPPNKIAWISGLSWHKFEVRTDPSGFEDSNGGQYLYVCRRRANNDTLPGKLWFWMDTNDRDASFCVVNYENRTSNSGEYEILYSAPGTVSWKSYDGTVEPNAIVGGYSGEQIVYVCSASLTFNGKMHLIMGWLDPNRGFCFLDIGYLYHVELRHNLD